MQHKLTQKYYASADVIAIIQRDGLGWGHDLERGCFEAPARSQRSFSVKAFIAFAVGG